MKNNREDIVPWICVFRKQNNIPDAQKKYVMHCMTRISQQECRGILEQNRAESVSSGRKGSFEDKRNMSGYFVSAQMSGMQWDSERPAEEHLSGM